MCLRSQARSEVYVGKLRQQLCFLPGLPWLQMGSWALPEKPVQALATSVRRTARLLWTVHLSFQEGFDEVCRRPYLPHHRETWLVHAMLYPLRAAVGTRSCIGASLLQRLRMVAHHTGEEHA